MHFEAILFDLGNTLVTQYVKERVVMREALKKIGLTIFPWEGKNLTSVLIRGYDDVYKEINHFRETFYVEIPIDSWLSKLLIQTQNEELSENVLNEAKKIIVDARSSFVKTFDKVPDMLEELRIKYQLGIISNTSSSESTYKVLSKLKIMHFFDTIVTSAECGIRKPYPGIFIHALKKLKVKIIPLTVFVGDSPIHDIRGARNVGMKTILVSKDRINRSTNESDIVINEVMDVPNALERLS